jgi:hypothetical protein
LWHGILGLRGEHRATPNRFRENNRCRLIQT